MTQAPPVLTDEFFYAVHDEYWNNGERNMSSRQYYYWSTKYHPIEDEI